MLPYPYIFQKHRIAEVANYTGVLCLFRRLDEQTKLSEALQRHLKLQAGQASMHTLLQQYVDAGMEQLGLLLRQEHRPVSDALLLPKSVCYRTAIVYPSAPI